MTGNYDFLPCTPAGVMELLKKAALKERMCCSWQKQYCWKATGDASLHNHGTVTICHSKTKNLKEICSRADILVVL